MQELSKLGSPQQRLMEVVRRDKDIRDFFSRYLEDIINYREGTLRNISKLYRDVLKSPKAIKKIIAWKDGQGKIQYNLVPIQEDTEYDIREIYSTITLLGIIRIIV